MTNSPTKLTTKSKPATGSRTTKKNQLIKLLPEISSIVSALFDREEKQQHGLGHSVGLALVCFGGSGLVMAWSAIAILGSSSELMFLANVALVALAVGMACFAVLWVSKETKNEEVWVSEVQDGAETVQLGLMGLLRSVFSFSGTVRRRGYLISQLAIGFIQVVSVLWLFENPEAALPWLLILASAVSMLAFGARRTRDTGVSHWWFLLFLVPALNLAVLAFLFLVPTDEFKGRGF